MIWEIIILVLGIPVGYLIAFLARDELKDGRIWFELIIFVSFIFGIVYYAKDESYVTMTCAFIGVVSLVSLWKSYDRKWIRMRKA